MKIDSNKIAILETVLAVASFAGAQNQSNAIVKSSLYLTTAYLLYGAYLNSQGRVQLLPKK